LLYFNQINAAMVSRRDVSKTSYRPTTILMIYKHLYISGPIQTKKFVKKVIQYAVSFSSDAVYQIYPHKS